MGCGTTGSCGKKVCLPERADMKPPKRNFNSEGYSENPQSSGAFANSHSVGEDETVSEYCPVVRAVTERKWNMMCSIRLHRVYPESENGELPKEIQKVENERSLAQFKMINPTHFKRRLAEGPSNTFRWLGWRVALQVKKVEINGLYEELRQGREECQWLSIILKDRDRTFPNHPLLCEMKNRIKLENILVAYANYNKVVGYCQGMNYLAGLLLIVSGGEEEEAFWAFVALMERKIEGDPLNTGGMKQMFVQNFPLLRIMQGLFDHLFVLHSPRLREHFAKINLPDALWLQHWCISLFIYSFPLNCCLRFWDAILAHGISFILPLSLVIIKELSPKMLVEDLDECNNILKRLHGKYLSLLATPDILIRNAQELLVDWKQLNLHMGSLGAKIELEEIQRNVKREECNPQNDSQSPNSEEQPEMEDMNNSEECLKVVDRTPPILQKRIKGGTISPKKRREKLKLPPIQKVSRTRFTFSTNIIEEKFLPILFYQKSFDSNSKEKVRKSSRKDSSPTTFTTATEKATNREKSVISPFSRKSDLFQVVLKLG